MYYVIIVACAYMLIGCIVGIIFQKGTNHVLENEDLLYLCMKVGRYYDLNALYDMIEFLDKWIMWIWPVVIGIWIGGILYYLRDINKK